jgi:hypothetical protein
MPKKTARRASKKTVKRTVARSASSTVRPMTSATYQPTVAQPFTGPTQLGAIFLIMLVVNVLVVYATNMFFPYMVVLGNARYTAFSALLFSMFAFTLVLTLATPVIERVAAALSVKLGMMHWMGLYFVLNTVTLWSLARQAETFGLGIASWGVVVILAFVLNFLQGLAITKLVYKTT